MRGGEILTVVYLDSVFALNLLMDYLLVASVARLSGLPVKRGRYFTAALAGGGYACSVFLPGMEFLAQTPIKLAAGILMALIAFGGETHFFRLTLLLFMLSCALAGAVLAFGMLAGSNVPVISGIFYTNVDAGVLLAAASAAWMLSAVVFRCNAAHHVRGELLRVRINIGTGTAAFTALYDNGNTLKDPYTGHLLPVVSWTAISHLLPKMQSANPMELEAFRCCYPDLQPGVVTYRAVGVQSGLLLTLRTCWVEVNGRKSKGMRIAISQKALGDGYAALWNVDGKRECGGNYETLGTMPAVADSVGRVAESNGSLHRRKRYSASSS